MKRLEEKLGIFRVVLIGLSISLFIALITLRIFLYFTATIAYADGFATGGTVNPKAKLQIEKTEKTEVVLEKIEFLEVQNLIKDVELLQLRAQTMLNQRQQMYQQKLEELKKKYNLDGNWDISPDGTKFEKQKR